MSTSQMQAARQVARRFDPDRPVLIAGPTASGKSALALALAQEQGGIVVNADAIQVYENWRILTARPAPDEEAMAPHRLYGHIPGSQPYSVGDWLREVAGLLDGPERVIIVGGTGLYFSALTEGLAQIPPTPPEVRAEGEARLAQDGLNAIIGQLDAASRARIDLKNPARVMRAWEVLETTGKGIAQWQDETPPPILPIDHTQKTVFDAPKDWLTPRIDGRFRKMVEAGALEEARSNLQAWSPTLPSSKAIGAAELIAVVKGDMPLETAIDRATVLTRQFAKRQRTWFKARMAAWPKLHIDELS